MLGAGPNALRALCALKREVTYRVGVRVPPEAVQAFLFMYNHILSHRSPLSGLLHPCSGEGPGSTVIDYKVQIQKIEVHKRKSHSQK